MTDLATILADPAQAEQLSPQERKQLRRQCVTLMWALSEEPESNGAHDVLLTAEQVAERLNLSVGWVRDNTKTELKSVRVELGHAVRYSENALNELIQKRRGG